MGTENWVERDGGKGRVIEYPQPSLIENILSFDDCAHLQPPAGEVSEGQGQV